MNSDFRACIYIFSLWNVHNNNCALMIKSTHDPNTEFVLWSMHYAILSPHTIDTLCNNRLWILKYACHHCWYHTPVQLLPQLLSSTQEDLSHYYWGLTLVMVLLKYWFCSLEYTISALQNLCFKETMAQIMSLYSGIGKMPLMTPHSKTGVLQLLILESGKYGFPLLSSHTSEK